MEDLDRLTAQEIEYNARRDVINAHLISIRIRAEKQRRDAVISQCMRNPDKLTRLINSRLGA